MHVHFDPETVDWRVYLVQSGGGGGFYVGRPYQRGAGIGAVLGGIFRFLLPVLKGVGRELGREGLAVGSKVLGEVAQGKALRDSLIEGTADGLRNVIDRTKPSEGLRNLVNAAATRLQQQQRGRGVKGQSKKRAPRIPYAKQRNVRSHTAKRRGDSFSHW
jgi:hypothetical protein